MGCDIHLHQEIKIDEEWHHYGQPSIERHYSLFALMAGVRLDNPKPVIEPKHILPPDISIPTRVHLSMYEGDGHTYSWFSSDEIERFQAAYEKTILMDYHLKTDFYGTFGYLYSNGWKVYPSSRAAELGVQDSRWIFWFDN